MPPYGPPLGGSRPPQPESKSAPRKGRSLVREVTTTPAKRTPVSDGEAIAKERANEKYYVLLNGIRVHKREFWLGMLILVLFIAAAAVPAWILWGDHIWSDHDPAPKATPSASYSIDEKTLAEADTTGTYRSAISNMKAAALQHLDNPTTQAETVLAENLQITGIDGLRSLAMNGLLSINGRKLDINVFSREPNLARQVLRTDNTKSVLVFDGTQAGSQVHSGGQSQQIPTPPAQKVALMLMQTPPLLVWQYAQNALLVDEGEPQKIGGIEHVCLINRGLPFGPIEHYFNPETKLETARRAVVKTSGGSIEIWVWFDDYRRTGNYFLAHEIRSRETGGISINSRLTVDEWEPNAGLLPSLFQVEND